MSIGHNEMSIAHTGMSIRPSDKQKCPLDIQMSIRPLDEQKCPVDIEMSIGHFAEVLDINQNISTYLCFLGFSVLFRIWCQEINFCVLGS